jgi:hypothetical protein
VECDASVVDPPTETNRSESAVNQDEKEQTLTSREKRSTPKPAPPQKRTPATASPESNSKRGRTFTDREKNAIVVGVRRFGLGKWKEIKTTFGATLQHRSTVQIEDCFRTMVQQGQIVESQIHAKSTPTENHPTPPSRQILPRKARNDVSYTSDTRVECNESLVAPLIETHRSESAVNQDKKEHTLTTRGKRSTTKPAPPQKKTSISTIKKKRKIISTKKASIANTRILRSNRSRLRY